MLGATNLSEPAGRERRVARGHRTATAAVAAVIAWLCTPIDSGARVSPTAALEDQVLAIVNQRRASGVVCGDRAYPPAGPLMMSDALRLAARGHSEDMAANQFFSHMSPDGRTFEYRIRDSGYAGDYPWGENIAGGHATPQAAVDGWMASPGHCANIMSPRFKAMGAGYALRPGSPYAHYWTQSFGGS
jgi:uncharacterized protein YkwD